MAISYKDAGVDVEKGDKFVERIKSLLGSTYDDRVVSGAGGFAALYDMGDRFLASGTDGVGTKLMIAQMLNKHDTIGIDLVAMCVNDILCTGARPLFFLDYLASGNLNIEVHSQVVEGIVEGCKQSGCALIGGETAEMPGMYSDGEYDLAGFSVGEVYKDKLISGKNVREGDIIFGLPSSGFHSNGYSLVRKLVKETETDLLEKCLTPTKIYVKEILNLLETHKDVVHGLAHITGGGFDNIQRINKDFKFNISNFEFLDSMPEFMKEVCSRSGLSNDELLKTFNMGIGFVIVGDSSLRGSIPGLVELGDVLTY